MGQKDEFVQECRVEAFHDLVKGSAVYHKWRHHSTEGEKNRKQQNFELGCAG